MNIFNIQSVVANKAKEIGKNFLLGSIPGMKSNPIGIFGKLPDIGSVLAGVMGSKLPINPAMLGFLGPQGLMAGIIVAGMKGFAESAVEGGTGKRRPMPERPDGAMGKRRPMEAASNEQTPLEGKIDEIMNSNMSVAEKITMLAAVMADSLDKQAEDVMKDWSDEAKRSVHQGDHKDTKGTEGNSEAKNSQYLQVRLQQLMEKKNQLISLASNINKADHTTKSAVIRNIQV